MAKGERPGKDKKATRKVKRRWRPYETAAGNRPTDKFFDKLSDDDAAAVLAAMKEVRDEGLSAARHLDDEIYEVRADGKNVIYRVLFAPQSTRKQVLLTLDGFKKKTQKTPPEKIALAKRRLADWNRRGDELREKKRTGEARRK